MSTLSVPGGVAGVFEDLEGEAPPGEAEPAREEYRRLAEVPDLLGRRNSSVQNVASAFS